MADVRPFRALRYNPELDLGTVVCPPFDTISSELQDDLYERSPNNAVRIELAKDNSGNRYENAARTLKEWIRSGVLRRDANPAFYLLQQTFPYGDRAYTRRLLFARLRVVPWSEGAVLPHEQTFPKHKADRLELMRAAHINGSPVFLFYRDESGLVDLQLMAAEALERPVADFDAADGQHLTLHRIDKPVDVENIRRAVERETLYVADGHHRYETALMYRDEVRAQRAKWTGEEPENFALVGLVAAEDPGMLVLPTHRIASASIAPADALTKIERLFNVQRLGADPGEIVRDLGSHPDKPAFALIAGDPESPLLLTIKDGDAVDALLPHDRSPAWRALDYAIADYALLRGCLGLSEEQTKDQKVVWFTEDAAEAVRQVREGRANYAVILNPVPVMRILELADAGERMPQKSTFFYPKVPTGLVFNLLED